MDISILAGWMSEVVNLQGPEGALQLGKLGGCEAHVNKRPKEAA